MTSSTSSDTGQLLHAVLADLEKVVGGVGERQLADPTPCPDFEVADLRRHILGWLTFFAAAAADPEGATQRPDPQQFQAPDSTSAAAAAVGAARRTFDTAIAGGVADGEIKLPQGGMPGSAALQLILWEYLVHGWDLATATGQQWDPPTAAAEGSLRFAKGMLTPEWRGKDFGDPIEVPDDASALDKVLGFTGRDPSWQAA